ncbi:hypothetical protein LOTGIDRAFT_153922 [Lottia gigantea]|uniref:Uncharacterized protein n=1 Tax=Lottia gigantea TaxID=225164 RepID=V4BRH6_LOTGI|nr:hypothetical protein LOTGIDRAFT_153922 [Lottia gigantea]ESO91479.1 hypothetical protein LOTGIDRAFT_153922 [Lottia gigantea]
MAAPMAKLPIGRSRSFVRSHEKPEANIDGGAAAVANELPNSNITREFTGRNQRSPRYICNYVWEDPFEGSNSDDVIAFTTEGQIKITKKTKHDKFSVEQWGYANLNILKDMISSGELDIPGILDYLDYSMGVFRLFNRHIRASVLLYDKEYRDLQARMNFPWGTIRQDLHNFQLLPKQTLDNLNRTKKLSNFDQASRRMIRGPVSPEGKEVCHRFNNDNCENAKCHCNSGNVWSLILSVLPNSSVDYGTGQELYNSVNAGKGLKVSIINGNPEYTTIYSIEHSGASVSNNIWAITIENVKLNHLNTTDSFLARHRLEISSAQPYASEWSMTFNDRKESVVYFENFAIKWFQENKIGSSPCLEMKNGNVIIGSMTNCLKDINKGADMYLNEEKRTNTKATSVLSTATYLVGYRYPLPAHRKPADVYYFPKPIYTINNIEFSHGTNKYLKWYVGSAKYLDNYTTASLAQWLTDNCWIESAFISDSGYIISGSILHLLESLKNGIPIKVGYNNYISNIKDVISINKTVIAVIEDILDDFNLIEGIMIRRMVSTSGLIVSVSHILEQTSTNISTIETGGTRWYVESRQTWEKILTFDGSRDVVYGSKDQVYDAAVNGSGFRIVIEHSESVYRYAPIDIVHVYNSTFVVLETGIISSIEFDGDEYRSFQWDGFLSTNGVYETVKWTTGSDLLQFRTIVNYNRLDVFIQN